MSARRRRGAGFMLGAALTSTFLLMALLAQFWTPYDPTLLDIVHKLQPPSAGHWFGTDQLGRDVLSMIMAGSSNSVGVALLSVLIGLLVGVPCGLLAAARPGLIDDALMRGNDILFAFPSLLLAILITAVFGPGAVNAIIAIGIFNIPVFARVTRGGALDLWNRDYILAARVAGKGASLISAEHILPNLLGVLTVQVTIQFSLGVIAEAGLSYVGLGAQPPTASWGRMLNEAQTLTALAPSLALFPGLAVALFVLGLNLLGDGFAAPAGDLMAGDPSREPLLCLDGLDVFIGDVQILNGVSLRVAAGEIMGLVGASGSGKSMTALAIMQLLPHGARLGGSIRLQGAALTGMSEAGLQAIRGRDIGMVFQEPMTALNPLMRIGDQVAETVRLHGSESAAAARGVAREALDAVGLTGEQGALDRYPHELSGGQRQRVAIAMAIALRPSLLIADEPTTALDVGTQAQVLSLLADLARNRGMGLLLVSHDLAVVAQMTDRVAVMHDGAIVEEGATTRTLHRLQHPYARALLAAAELKPRVRGAPGAAARAVLEVQGIVRDYPRRRRSPWRAEPKFRAVDHVSLIVNSGETVGLVGESGSGKSSLLRAILRLEPIESGTVRLLGESLSTAGPAALRRLRRSIQAVFQDPFGSFDPRWTVERLIAEPFHLLDRPPAAPERRRRVSMVLEQVGLSPAHAGRHPHEFSGGQRQRIAIARALVTEPAVVVFDEAVSALDVVVRGQILDLLAELAERRQLAYLFVSHDLNVIRAIADRVYVMQTGRIIEEGVTATVFASPQHSYTRGLIAATPRFE